MRQRFVPPKGSLTLTVMAGLRMGLSKERRPFNEAAPFTADDLLYTATAMLWKVEVTASNV